MKAEDYNRVLSTAADKIRKDNSFVRRNYPVFWIALILYLLCTAFSGAAIFAHVNIRAVEIFGSLWAGILTGVITVIILGAQFVFKFVVDDWQAGVITKGGADFYMMLFKSAFGLTGMIFAIMLSWSGAAKITDYKRNNDTFEKVKLVSVDSIANYYDSRIAQINGQIGKQEGTTYKRRITAQANQNLSVLFSTVSQLESEKAKAIKDVTEKNDAALANYRSETVENQSYARGFAGIAEALALLCIILMGIFDDGLKKEAKEIGVRVEQDF